MNLDDTISKINSIDPVALEERLRIKPHSDKAIKKFDETCEKIAKNEPKVCMTIAQARFLEFSMNWVQEFGYRGAARKAFDKQVEKLSKRIKQAEAQND